MELPLAYYGNPILRKKGQLVSSFDQEIRNFVQNMVDTMEAHRGIGLAAPQVGRSLLLFITCVPIYEGEDNWKPGTLRIFINPKILEVSSEKWSCQEGCLSIPKIYLEIERPLKVTVRAQNLEGEFFEETFTHLEAHAVLHENDHINGVLFIDRVHGKERQRLEPFLRAIKAKYNSRPLA